MEIERGVEMSNGKFLIADDAMFARKQLKKILENQGYEVVAEAVDGVDVVEKYKEFLPDYVFMDVVMPERDGVTAVKKIMEYDQKANIIMLSAVEQKTILFEAIEAGALNYLIKPYKPEDIVSIINLTEGHYPKLNIKRE